MKTLILIFAILMQEPIEKVPINEACYGDTILHKVDIDIIERGHVTVQKKGNSPEFNLCIIGKDSTRVLEDKTKISFNDSKKLYIRYIPQTNKYINEYFSFYLLTGNEEKKYTFNFEGFHSFIDPKRINQNDTLIVERKKACFYNQMVKIFLVTSSDWTKIILSKDKFNYEINNKTGIDYPVIDTYHSFEEPLENGIYKVFFKTNYGKYDFFIDIRN